MFAFLNGLHIDSCDIISQERRSTLFPVMDDDPNKWKDIPLEFPQLCYPTTLGYQYVWKHEEDKKRYNVVHHFVMHGLGLAIRLQDSMCHHFMAGAFAHSTGLCYLEENWHEDEIPIILNNAADFFHVFAWGSAANTRTDQGNPGGVNASGDHHTRQAEHRSCAPDSTVQERSLGGEESSKRAPCGGDSYASAAGIRCGGGTSSTWTSSTGSRRIMAGITHLGRDLSCQSRVANTRATEALAASAIGAPASYVGDDEDTGPVLIFEDDDYEEQEPDNKKMRGKLVFIHDVLFLFYICD